MGDEIELAVPERELGRVGFPERDPVDIPPGFLEHRRGDVHADNLRVGIALGDRLSPRPGPRPDVESPLDPSVDPAERRGEGSEDVRPSHLVPHRSEALELQSDERPEKRPEGRPADDGIRREPREAPADLFYSESARSRTSVPALTWNVSAAFPREIASAMFR